MQRMVQKCPNIVQTRHNNNKITENNNQPTGQPIKNTIYKDGECTKSCAHMCYHIYSGNIDISIMKQNKIKKFKQEEHKQIM